MAIYLRVCKVFVAKIAKSLEPNSRGRYLAPEMDRPEAENVYHQNDEQILDTCNECT